MRDFHVHFIRGSHIHLALSVPGLPLPEAGRRLGARSAANASLPTAVSSKVKAPVTASPSCALSCRAVPPSAKRLYAATPARRRGSRMWYAPVYLGVRVIGFGLGSGLGFGLGLGLGSGLGLGLG